MAGSEKILEGLRDALAYTQGDESRARIWHPPSKEAMDAAAQWMANSGRGQPYEMGLAKMFDAYAAARVAEARVQERERLLPLADRALTMARRYPGYIGVSEAVEELRDAIVLTEQEKP